MEKYAWTGRIVEGMIDEYVKRHDDLWPEMAQMLESAGIRNYSIWNAGDRLFGYYECENGVDFAARTQKEHPITAKWNEYMKDILILEMDPVTGAQPLLRQVFAFR
jgi:L-rhamnose mutarotase